jgi:hypothetical protein
MNLSSVGNRTVGFLRIRLQAAQYRPCHGYNLSRVPGLAGRSEDFLYASDNVGDSFFLFEEALPIFGPQRIGGAFGGHGVFFMQALELGAFLGADDGAGLGHESILLPTEAIPLATGNIQTQTLPRTRLGWRNVAAPRCRRGTFAAHRPARGYWPGSSPRGRF